MSELAIAPVLPRPIRRPGGLFRRGLIWTFRSIIGIYFRAIETAGNLPAASTGARLFVANHVNGLVDPILVLTAAPCPISPVAKSTLWKIPGLRWLLEAADAVPIVRRRDDPTKQSSGNDEVFDKIAAWLAGGQNILIFSEGTSHSNGCCGRGCGARSTGSRRRVIRSRRSPARWALDRRRRCASIFRGSSPPARRRTGGRFASRRARGDGAAPGPRQHSSLIGIP